VRGRVVAVTMGSLPTLHKTSRLMLRTLHHMGVLDFVVIGDISSDRLIAKDSLNPS
jgi:hypothetical protein